MFKWSWAELKQLEACIVLTNDSICEKKESSDDAKMDSSNMILKLKSLMESWFAHGVRHFKIDGHTFYKNKKGFPVLSKHHQLFLKKFMRYDDVTIILSGINGIEKNAMGHAQYLNHLRRTCKPLSKLEASEKAYWDVLQTPLQPLSDNLDYSTYETFESDPVKYVRYEEALVLAIHDWIHAQKGQFKGDSNEYKLCIMVLGAGRGPLVDCSLRAINQVLTRQKKIGDGKGFIFVPSVYAIEKNPHALVILRKKKELVWKDRVSVVATDMRKWTPEERADIIVSELLGSFGDNELSPECLDGAQRAHLLKKTGVSIPQKYGAYIEPISSSRLYRKLEVFPKDFEMPYVVRMMSIDDKISVNGPKKCWEYVHPLHSLPNEGNVHNNRFVELSFKSNKNTLIHGFAGYFDTQLYGKAYLSIVPKTYSHGMFSWYPMWFPIHTPVYVSKDDVITIHIWRKSSHSCVWFEWCLINPIKTPIHNPGHRSYRVNLD